MKSLFSSQTRNSSVVSVFVAVAIAALTFTLGSCRSKKVEVVPTDPSVLANADPVTRVNYNRVPFTGIRSKVDLTISRGSNRISVGGRLRMKRNEIIQVSIMPHGLVEIGILELTPEYFMVVDKWGKQYVKEKWSSMKALSRANIDFYSFQALFWEELFVPGRGERALREDFEVSELGETMRLQPTAKAASRDDVELAFVARTLSGLIQQTVVTASGRSDLRFAWNYNDWVNLNGKDFPGTMVADINVGSNEVKATFGLVGLQVDEKLGNLNTKINTDRYRKVDFESILTRIMAM